MRAQSWALNLAAAVIATSTIFIVSAKERDIRITTYLVRINVSVTDGDNRPIPDLAHKDFAIFEDNIAQQIDYFSHDDSSLSFSLAFDISDYEPMKLMARQVARSFVVQIRSTDEVTIPQLNADSQAVLGFAADERSLENALVEIPSNDKLVGLVADAIKSTRSHRSLDGAVVVITDGRSLSGTASDRDAAYAILRRGTPIYFIILDDGRYMTRSAAQSRGQRTRGLLTRLAAASGGLALVVKSEDEISAATEQIIHRLKNQYTIAYSPTNEKYDGSFRYVRVTVMPKDNRKVKVFAPSGYYAVYPEKIKEEKINDK
jgi:VWFA-related protein